jgi:chemotaxis protein CheC
VQLDALRELANIASGTAATALSRMLGREVNMSVPRALAVPLAEAVDAVGDPAEEVYGIVLELVGGFEALVLLLIGDRDADTLCRLLGVTAGSELGDSALGEIGNILGSSYLSALGTMTRLSLFPGPPALQNDLLGAIVASVLAQFAGAAEIVLAMDSELEVGNEPCSLTFILVPAASDAAELLAPLGLMGGN